MGAVALEKPIAPAGGDKPCLPNQFELPFRNSQNDRIAFAFSPVVISQLAAKPPDLDTNKRILDEGRSWGACRDLRPQ